MPRRTRHLPLNALLAALVAACSESTAPGSPTQLTFITTPAGVSAGQAINPQIQVAIQDGKGRTVTSVTTTVTIALGSNPSGGTLAGTVSATATGGVATFTDLRIDKSGSGYTLSASAQGLTSAATSTFGVGAGAAARLAFTAQPVNAVAGATMSLARVAVLDASDNVVASFTSPISLALVNAGGAAIVGPSSVPPTNGVATFQAMRITRAGSGYALVASAPGVSAQATSALFAITPAAASKIAFVTNPPAQVDGGRPMVPAVQVALQDAYGNTNPSASGTVTLSLANNPGSGTLSGSLSGTISADAVNGVATFANVFVDRPANGYTLTASGLSTTATSSQFNVVLLFTSVSAGGNQFVGHTCAVSTAGAAYCWGADDAGQLGGFSYTGSRFRPQLVHGGLTFTQVSAGGYHTCGVTTDSDVYCWGYNGDQQLGNGSTSQIPGPNRAVGSLKFTSVAAGDAHTCALSTTGIVYCWGNNQDGRSGSIPSATLGEPTAVGGLTFQAVTADSAHSCALSSGTAYCWGSNDFGQLGDASLTQRSSPAPVAGGLSWSRIVAGGRHTCAVRASTQLVYCWGNNSNWQLADGAAHDRATPRTSPQPQSSGSLLTQVSQLTAGADFTCAIGTVNGQGSPVVWCWGANDKYQMGIDTKNDSSLPGTVGGGASNILRIDSGRSHSCEVLPSGQIACWGDNRTGQLGDGTTIARRAPTLIAP